MSPGLDYHVVDVFTEVAYGGNPLAVVLGADALSTRQLQLVAREFALSETAFPMAASAAERARGVAYRLRIFTPVVEIPFAGHPSVGTAWLLAHLGQVQPGVVVQSCEAGELPLVVAPDGGPVELAGAKPVVSGPVDPTAALAAVGLVATDLTGSPARNASAGLGYTILPVTREALERCRPDFGLLAAYAHPAEATGVYVVAWDGAARTARARMFAGDLGGPEDPATGSAALALGAALVADGALTGSGTYEVVQGAEMGRESRLSCTVEVADGVAVAVRVRGQVVPVAAGRIQIPG
jgi:trans-2,3-dihydro-3-hydroxyanthranilate isomerase